MVQELCETESRGSRPGLAVPTSLLASVDVKLLILNCHAAFGIAGLSLFLIRQPTSEDIKQLYLPTYPLLQLAVCSGIPKCHSF